MTKDELGTELIAIRREHRELQQAHEVLRANPRDRPGHRTHLTRLRRHLERIHTWVDAMHGGAAREEPQRQQPETTDKPKRKRSAKRRTKR